MVNCIRSIFIPILFIISSSVSATTYYVSSSGNDLADGKSTSTSWATLNKVNGFSFAAGDNILFNRGDVFYGTLTISHSGASGNRITYSAYGTGANPVITGFTTISGWTNYGNGIYSKVVSKETDINVVTVNGVNTAMGRTPDAGTWATYESCGDSYIVDNQLSGSPDWTGADVVIKKEGYIVDRLLITNHSGNTITYSTTAYNSKGDATGMAGGNGHNGWGYFIQNDIRTLTTLGEWYYNGTTFYMYFGAVDPTTKVVKVANLDNGIVCNANYVTIDNINFQGFSKIGLDAKGGNHVIATNCEIGFLGSYAVFPSTNCTIDNSYLHDTGGVGIFGTMAGLTLTNSTLENIGIIDGAWYGWAGLGMGILNFASNIIVQYNRFINTAGDGTNIAGSADNVLIDKNFFDNCCSRSFDQGAIYVTGTGKTNYVISSNIILNTVGSALGTTSISEFPNRSTTVEGIYLDEPCSGVTVSGNTVANITSGCGIKFHLAHDMIVSNNTIYNAHEGYQFLASGSYPNDPIRNIDMDDNKIIAKSAGQYLLVFDAHSFDDIPQFGTANDQYYARPINDGVDRDFWTDELSDGDDWGNYRTYAYWLSRSGESNSNFSPVTVTDVNKLRFEYNATKSNKVVSLDAGYIDVTGTKYSGSITLLPYTSAVLMVDPNPDAPPASPEYVSSAIASTSPAILEMTYNLNLANIVPASSAFSVKVNSTSRTINNIAISGTKVQLTMASPIVNGDIVTVSYIKPLSNPLQTPAGGQAATLSAQTVVNNVLPVPIYISSAIQNATPNILEITYNLSLANIVPSSTAFAVTVNSLSRSITSVTISGTKIFLTLATSVVYGDIVKVSYTKTSINPLQTSAGGQAATFSAQTVVNNVLAIPVYVSSAIQNTTPNILEITYNLSLANIVPPVTAFSVSVNSLRRSINSVTISGTKVLLALASSVVYGDIVTVGYTKPATNPLQISSGGLAATISGQPVSNRVTDLIILSYANSTVANSNPALLEIVYNLALANIVPPASAFSVNVNSTVRKVNTVTIAGNSIFLTLETEVQYGDVVTVAYTKPGTNPLQSSSGLQAATMSAQSVTNKVSPLGPVYVSSIVENLTPSMLEITYNETLDLSTPSASAFIVMVNGVKREVISVSISDNKVILTLASPVVFGDVITVSYIKPSSNQLKKTTGEPAVSFSLPQPVKNNLSKISIKNSDISVYPNPALDFVNISIMETSLETQILRIFDLSGKLCMESKLNAGINNKVLINIKSGIYIFQILSGPVIRFVQKVIIL